MPTLSTVGSFLENLPAFIVPANTVSYTRPTPLNPPIRGVPAQYGNQIMQNMSRIQKVVPDMATSTYVAHINAENGGNWSPTLRGRRNANDLGITQLNTSPTGAVAEITGARGGPNFFQQAWGHPMNVHNPYDQLRGDATYMDYLGKYYLPQVKGIAHPNQRQVISAYNSSNPSQGRSYWNLVNDRAQNVPATTTP